MCAGEVGIRSVAEHGGGECICVTGRKSEAVFAFAQEVVRRADVIARDDRQARAERLVHDDTPAVVPAGSTKTSACAKNGGSASGAWKPAYRTRARGWGERGEHLRQFRLAAHEEQACIFRQGRECGEEVIHAFARDHLSAEKKRHGAGLARRSRLGGEGREVAVVGDIENARLWKPLGVVALGPRSDRGDARGTMKRRSKQVVPARACAKFFPQNIQRERRSFARKSHWPVSDMSVLHTITS